MAVRNECRSCIVGGSGSFLDACFHGGIIGNAGSCLYDHAIAPDSCADLPVFGPSSVGARYFAGDDWRVWVLVADVFNSFFAEQDRRLLHTLRDGVSYNLRAHPISLLDETYYADIYTTPLKNDEGRMAGAVGVYRDVTRQKRLEQEMLQKDKLSLIGQMAAGTMHEIRNPLAIAKGHLELAFSKLHRRNQSSIANTDAELIRHFALSAFSWSGPIIR